MKSPVTRPRTRAILVTLLTLEVLGFGGYLGQIWWASRLAEHFPHWNVLQVDLWEGNKPSYLGLMLEQWQRTPWYGTRVVTLRNRELWLPRRTYYEHLKRITGKDLSNNSSAWKAWLKAHPDLIWDEKLERLVDAPGPPTPMPQ